MKKIDVESTIESKIAFEYALESFGVKVSHYHSDNEIFGTNYFKGSVSTAEQGLPFFGLNVYHHSRKDENQIKNMRYTQGHHDPTQCIVGQNTLNDNYVQWNL